jgi:hypothetical protein
LNGLYLTVKHITSPLRRPICVYCIRKLDLYSFGMLGSVDWKLPTFRQSLSVPSLRAIYLIPNFPMHVTCPNYLTFFDSLTIIQLVNRTSSSVFCHCDRQNLTCCIAFYFAVDLNLKLGLSGVMSLGKHLLVGHEECRYYLNIDGLCQR